MAYPTVYPTGTTVYNPERCWNGYTVFPAKKAGAALIDMNGSLVQLWKGLDGQPNKILPGGFIMGSTGLRNLKYGYQDMLDLCQLDWGGNVVLKFNQYERIKDPRSKPVWMARQHHDYQREGNPVGYYVPGMDPFTDRGNTFIVCHKNLKNPKISEFSLIDDAIIEVNWDGKIVWEWICSDHFDELGFSEEAKNTMHRNPSLKPIGGGDWMHMNSMSLLGPNKWFDMGDDRFHPDNIIWDGSQTNIMAITDKSAGKIVWKIGPDYTATAELRKLGQIIGQHHAHMIPRGLPGEGNILVFDNGGWAGYGTPNPGSPTGIYNALRDYSRVLEFDPIKLEITWEYTPHEAGFNIPVNASNFYSGFISSSQRLPNGNTLITEGSDGRIFEVTNEHEIVWEYISPYVGKEGLFPHDMNMVYRAYRIPYEWIPQLDQPEEVPISPTDNSKFRLPGASGMKAKRITRIKVHKQK